ncbi:MAG: type II toxin-antitoxin system RelE/ParE family toxin [Endomicrobiia bacterium]|nr:type II toxin-antitoxin system RelE/ParE family toxin [Endomicrobiia bacterium]
MYEIIILPDAENDIDELDASLIEGVLGKIEWLASNARNIAHHQLSSLPDELKGLCRLHTGARRILYWVSQEKRKIWIFRIEHRSTVYKKI